MDVNAEFQHESAQSDDSADMGYGNDEDAAAVMSLTGDNDAMDTAGRADAKKPAEPFKLADVVFRIPRGRAPRVTR
jgi:hypothetical protein